LRGCVVLALILVGYFVVGVAPASGLTTLDLAVVRGTDNGLYWTQYTSGGWGTWQSLGGSTPSAPGICENPDSTTPDYEAVALVVRGTDNGIYISVWSPGVGFGSWGEIPGGGVTIDQPSCGWFGGDLFIVVRGTGNELYWNSGFVSWSGWSDLHGASNSAPALVSTPVPERLDLFVQGTDNGIYHKAYKNNAWSSNWDSPGGSTLNPPTAALTTFVTGCPSCLEADGLVVVVRGTDNSIYANTFCLVGCSGWASWTNLGGATISGPTLAYSANGCPPGSMPPGGGCTSLDSVAVRGTDNAVYHATYNSVEWSTWDTARGVISNSPALAYDPSSVPPVDRFLLLVQGNPSNAIYSNLVFGSNWNGYSSNPVGATLSTPAIVAIV
jgi:hypothetical protein